MAIPVTPVQMKSYNKKLQLDIFLPCNKGAEQYKSSNKPENYNIKK